MAAADVGALFGGPGAQDGLGLALRDAAGAEVGALEGGEVELHAAEVADGADLQGLALAEAGQQSALVEELHGAGGEAQAAGLAGGRGQFVEDDHVGSAQAEFTGEHQSGGACAGDDDVGVHRGVWHGLGSLSVIGGGGRCGAGKRPVRFRGPEPARRGLGQAVSVTAAGPDDVAVGPGQDGRGAGER